jgi:hypothetical protein
MDYRSFIKKLENDGIVYIYDDYEDAIVKLVSSKVAGNTQAWIKRKGREEREIPQSEPIVLDIMMGGKEVNKNFYDNY